MFALWYLSLAIDEARKRFGWTFLDFFKIAKTPNNSHTIASKALPSSNNTITPNSTTTNAKADTIINMPTAINNTTDVKKTSNEQPAAPALTPAEAAAKQAAAAAAAAAKEAAAAAKSAAAAAPTAMVGDTINNILQEAVNITNTKKADIAMAKEVMQPLDLVDKHMKNVADKENADQNKNLKHATTMFIDGEATKRQKMNEPAVPKGKSETMVDAAVLAKLEEGYAKLAASDSKSLLKKYLTKEVFDNLKNKKTPTFGSTLLDCIQSGLENHDSGVGIYAPDAEAYTVFADLFDPIIEDYHSGFKKTDKHPQRDFGDVTTFGNVDPTNEYVISTRVRCGRSMQGYPFNPCLTEAQYKEMEDKVSSTLSGLEGELKGKFYPLTGMEKTVQQQLIDDHFLFKEGDRFLQAANACRFWPTGRGIYHNDNKTFLVWCNEEDHLRIISMQMGGDLGEVYRRLVTAVNDIEKRIPFSHDDRLGFLTFCPTNLGTTIRASVHIKVPKLAANKAKLEEVAGKYNLQVRGTRGEHTEAEGGVYDISNKRRMGLTEYQAVKEMYDGITELIKIEKSL